MQCAGAIGAVHLLPRQPPYEVRCRRVLVCCLTCDHVLFEQ